MTPTEYLDSLIAGVEMGSEISVQLSELMLLKFLMQASQQPAHKALTPEHIANLHRDAYTKCKAFTTLETYTAFARAIEAAHGITGSEG